jgi:predicted nuclease of predicted toxin-antitoxin system
VSLRLFTDHCVPMEIVHGLRADGHDVVMLREAMPAGSPDHQVIGMALRENRILLSLNGDFMDIVSYPPAHYNGIIAIQLHNRPQLIPALMNRLRAYFAASPDQEHYSGRLLVVEVHRIRMRT